MQHKWLFFKSQGIKQTQPSTHVILALQTLEDLLIYIRQPPHFKHILFLALAPKSGFNGGKKKKKSDLKANTQVNVIKYQKVKSIEVLCLGINVL